MPNPFPSSSIPDQSAAVAAAAAAVIATKARGSFEDEVLTRLARIETKQDAGAALSADHEARLRILEASSTPKDLAERVTKLENSRARLIGAATAIGSIVSLIIEVIIVAVRGKGHF
jgi:plasmid maintenance system killer protein